MQRLLCYLFISLIFISKSHASERLVISQWLKTNAVNISYPVFHEERNTSGKAFSDSDLLVFEHLDLSNFFPSQGKQTKWDGGQSLRWESRLSDENGYLLMGDTVAPASPELIYMAAYIKTSRWIEGQLEIKSPYMLEAWLNGKKIGTKTTIEREENTIGKATQTLKLPRGTHLLIIKALRPPQEGLPWKLMANIEIKEPFTTSDIEYGISPSSIKNILHILDGVKITRIEPSFDGKYYAISYSQSLPPSDQSESWTDIKRFSDGRLIHSFRNARIGRLTWLPKSNAVSYTTTREGKTTLHYHHIETGEQRILMPETKDFFGMQWSPDESFVIYSLRSEGSSQDATMRHLLNMNDRQPNWRSRSFLYKLDIASGIRSRLTHGNISTMLQDISPDGKMALVGMSWPDYNQEPFSRQALLLLDMESLSVDTLINEPGWGLRASFSPDGQQLLATAGPTAFGGIGQNIPEGTIPSNYDIQAYIYHLDTRQARCITLDFDPSVSQAYWHPHTNNIFLLTVDREYQRIYQYEVNRERFTLLETGLDFITGMQVAGKANIMTFLGNQANVPGKAYQMELRSQRTTLLEDTETVNYAHVEFGEVRKWNFTASSGIEIEGRYYLPPDFDPDEKYPLIVYYYGGMSPVGRTFGGRYPFNIWAGNGYIVYVLQPSGAIGFGQEFSAAHVNNWGITVADEIIEGTKKFLEAHPYTDPTKVGCAGASYGGFMTMLLLTRTDIFATAISHAGISSISSYWGEGFWGYAYSASATTGSFPWNRPDIYVGQSPLFHADRINTPLLLLTGDSDTNVPPGESIQMFTALRLLDRPVELVLVKGEDHHILTYSKRILWHNAIMAWWEKHLRQQPEWWEEQFPEKNYK